MKSLYYRSISYLHSMRAVYVQSNHDMWKEDIDKANSYRDSIQSLNLHPAAEWAWVPVATALDDERDDLKNIAISDLN